MYDPMVAKLIVWDADREQATSRMLRALGEYEIGGLKTLIPFHRAILATDQWANAETCRDLIEDREWLAALPSALAELPPASAGQPAGVGVSAGAGAGAGAEDSAAGVVESVYTVEVSGKRFDVRVLGAGNHAQPAAAPMTPAVARQAPRRRRREEAHAHAGASGDTLTSPLQGTVFKVLAEVGSVVEPGALICVIEAMKMENEITAHKAGVISELPIEVGVSVSAGDALAVIASE